eukprot:CAMPEP_0179150384 /NCGR_PEP_ID=MMETSP0796-20121207/72931_1 /TAXON_ID=73915 /ORGANISM="Pyrodinium bahamense, Strain pbaha01" /LENGTH=51 /DNA_ID=CAMNT_0020851351 /DNA_START=26 /DNA_END=178 /DNA_ORIENTATION=-
MMATTSPNERFPTCDANNARSISKASMSAIGPKAGAFVRLSAAAPRPWAAQ